MAASHAWLKRTYTRFNNLYFDGELPRDAEVVWETFDHEEAKVTWPYWTCGDDSKTHIPRIHIDLGLYRFPMSAKLTLLHEMIHVKHPKAKHGKVFKAERQRLWDIGAFDKLI